MAPKHPKHDWRKEYKCCSRPSEVTSGNTALVLQKKAQGRNRKLFVFAFAAAVSADRQAEVRDRLGATANAVTTLDQHHKHMEHTKSSRHAKSAIFVYSRLGCLRIARRLARLCRRHRHSHNRSLETAMVHCTAVLLRTFEAHAADFAYQLVDLFKVLGDSEPRSSSTRKNCGSSRGLAGTLDTLDTHSRASVRLAPTKSRLSARTRTRSVYSFRRRRSFRSDYSSHFRPSFGK